MGKSLLPGRAQAQGRIGFLIQIRIHAWPTQIARPDNWDGPSLDPSVDLLISKAAINSQHFPNKFLQTNLHLHPAVSIPEETLHIPPQNSQATSLPVLVQEINHKRNKIIIWKSIRGLVHSRSKLAKKMTCILKKESFFERNRIRRYSSAGHFLDKDAFAAQVLDNSIPELDFDTICQGSGRHGSVS